MKISRAFIAATLLTASALYAATRPTPSQDVTKVAGDSHTVIFENDQVRVLAVHFKPGQVAPMHSHPANVSYFLTDGKLKITLPDGKVIERIPASPGRTKNPGPKIAAPPPALGPQTLSS
jgi:quercetin dioxygenase-like cupin family protein